MRLKVNPHGIFGLSALVGMFIIAAGKGWEIPWLYFVTAVLLYSIAVIGFNLALEDSSSEAEKSQMFRFLLGCHLAFVFLALGMLLPVESGWVWAGVFMAALATGLVIPYLLFTMEK